MAKRLSCGDIVPGCDYVARGENEDEIMAQVAEHARTAHGVEDVSPEMADKARSVIRDE